MKSLHFHKPHLLVVVGIPGSGKTFFASQFADTFNAPFIHYEALQNTFSDRQLSEEDTATLAGLLFNQLIKTNQTIIIEGPGATKSERGALSARARAAGYECLFIWVQTEPATAKQRAVQGIRGGTNTTISQAEFDTAVKQFAPLMSIEHSIVISGKHTYASQARMVLKRLVDPEVKQRSVPTPTNERPTRSSRISIQ